MIYLWIPASITDPDLWWHMRNVQVQLARHAFLHRDVYSFTAYGSSWINHEWLAEIPFYLSWRIFGEKGIFLVTVVAIEIVLLGVFYLSYRRSGSIAATMIASVLAAFVSTVSFGPRTLLLGWICLVGELILLEHLSTDLRYARALPFLFALWVNLHGSWMIGIVVLLIFTLCTRISMKIGVVDSTAWPWKRSASLMVAGASSVGALFVNPYGWRLVAYPFDLAFRQQLNIATVEEWKSLDFHSLRAKVFLSSIAVLFTLQLLRKIQWTLYELSLVLIGIYAAVTYSRFLFLGAILVMPVLAEYLFVPTITQRSSYRGWIGLAVMVALLPLLIRHFPAKEGLDREIHKYPLQAVAFLKNLPAHARVFNEFAWGGFLEWNVHKLPVFIDSRVDLFEYNGTFRDYLDVIEMREPLQILDRQRIQYVLFEHDTPLVYLLEHNAGWRIVYRDDSAEVLERIVPAADDLRPGRSMAPLCR